MKRILKRPESLYLTPDFEEIFMESFENASDEDVMVALQNHKFLLLNRGIVTNGASLIIYDALLVECLYRELNV